MVRLPAFLTSKRLVVAAIVFPLFILFDISLFGWLLLRSLSQREMERALLETQVQAEKIAGRIDARAQLTNEDLYTAVVVEQETQTLIDEMVEKKDVVRSIEIRDAKGRLILRDRHQRLEPSASVVESTGEFPSTGRKDRTKVDRQEFPMTAAEVQAVRQMEVKIGSLGSIVIGISEGDLAKRTEVLRQELLRQASVIAVVTVGLLFTAYSALWWVTARARRLEKQALEAERMAYIGTLASGLAHEIRNPLNSLNLNMQMLEEEIAETGGAPTGRRLLSITRSEIGRLERLVTDFLAYAKPRPLEFERVAAVTLLGKAAEVLEAETTRRGVEVDLEDRSGGAGVRVDGAQMTQLLLNLVQNALAAMEESPRRPHLGLYVERDGEDVVLEIQDNGIGIRREDLDKVFDLFFSTRKGGTGLGLAIVDRIARAHGGRLSVDSVWGSGTVVKLALPAATESEERAANARDDAPSNRLARAGAALGARLPLRPRTPRA